MTRASVIAVFVAMIDASAPALTAGKLLTEHRSLRARLQRSASLFPPAPVNLVSVTPDMVLPPHQGLPVLRPRPARVALESLTLDGLSVGYGAGAPVLADVSLSVRRGELVVVTGPVGCGKSTLLSTLAGLVPPVGGRLLWNGVVIDDPSTFLRPPIVAYAAQVPHLLSGTVRDNVALDHDIDLQSALDLAAIGADVQTWGGGSAADRDGSRS